MTIKNKYTMGHTKWIWIGDGWAKALELTSKFVNFFSIHQSIQHLTDSEQLLNTRNNSKCHFKTYVIKLEFNKKVMIIIWRNEVIIN